MASSGPGYLDPDLIYALFYNRRSQDILKYLDSFPGSSDDPSCRTIRAMGELLLPNPVRGFVPVRDGPAWYHQNAMVAQSLAQTSRFCAPEMVDNPTNISPNPGHFMDPFNSSSYSGRMLTSHVPGSNVLRHAAMANQGSDSSSSISAATFNPLQANSNNVIKFPILDERPNQASAFNLGTHASAFVPWQANSTDGHYVNPYNSSSCSGRMLTSLVPGTRSNVVNGPLGHATMLNQASAPNSGIPPATFFPLQANSNDVTNYNLRHAAMLNQVSASNTGIPAAMVLPLQENSNHGHYMNPYNSSSCSGRMLTSLVPGTRSNVVNDPLGHATMLNQASAPNSGIPPATFFPLQANSNDVTNYNLRHAAMLNQVSASNTGIPAAMVLPLQENSNHGRYMNPYNSSSCSGRMLTSLIPGTRSNVVNDPLGHATMLNQASAPNSGIPPAAFFPVQANSNDVTNYNLRHAAMLNQVSASNTGIPAAMVLPLQENSNHGHYMNPYNSSSCSGRMLTSLIPGTRSNVVNDPLGHATMLNQASAPNSGIPPAAFFPLQANSNDVTNYNLRHAAMLNQVSASKTGIPTAMVLPLQENSNHVPALAVGVLSLRQPRSERFAPQELIQNTVSPQELEQSNRGTPAVGILSLRQPGSEQFGPRELMQNGQAPAVGVLSLCQPGSEQLTPQELMQGTISPQELEQNNRGTPAVGVLSLRQPGSEQFVPQELMQNAEVMPTADSKGMSDASEIIQQEEKSLRLSVASLIASDGTKGFAGVLIRGSKGQFITASCFPIPSMEPAMVFAAACCEAIKIAQFCQPTAAVVLESHLFPLLKNVLQQPVVLALKAILRKVLHRLAVISEESNGAARQLAMRALQMGVPELFLEIPDWLILN